MKKALLLLAAVLTTMAASAQFEIGLGGSFGIPGHKSYVGNVENKLDMSPYMSSFSIAPTLGFRLNDAMSVGAYIEFSQTKDHNPWMAISQSGESYRVDNITALTTYGFAPFFRYNVVSYGDIRIFFEFQAHANFGSMTNKDNDNGTMVNLEKYDILAMNIRLTPGASYQITDHISFDVFFNFVSLGYSMMNTTHVETHETDNTGKVSAQNVAIPADQQEKSNYAMIGLNTAANYYDLGTSNSYNLGTAIGVKLNVNF